MRAPKKKSKRYKEVVEAGCGGKYDPWNGDYDCSHGYEWNCDDCPIVLESIPIPDEINSAEAFIKWVKNDK